ncbi:P-loop containing nucleoside triphosphate hydrolase protein [Rhodocollybia butyracea]|uniref:P-loop containing nucleoside triphosphate hydrolase protein n=1 Tax=Rhodocollybia butyracea TaxID=206335 RepID=A0A9P5U5D8_9AGAR|nr:P-loop containing nucleoside triphosphate hydrolase protein [Rhodocollybia butyracea]
MSNFATQLSTSQRALLKRGNIKSLSDLILLPPQDIARRCKVSPLEILAIVDAVCKVNPVSSSTLEELLSSSTSYGICTSGDSILDTVLGGGFRTGMIWEVVGESAAGKTQLALRMSLLVQLSSKFGGLSGSACFLLTSGKLPTSRIMDICENHPLLASSEQCGLDDIHTMPVPNVEFMIHGLSKLLPDFVQRKLIEHESNSTIKPIRLVIIDALGELFHSSDKTSSQTLVQRSHNITEISSHLHSIASKYSIIIIVLNEVLDAFDRGLDTDELGLSYANQSRWFGRAHSLPGEDRKEASLGLVWANQINARIMMSRTGRRRDIKHEPTKRRRADVGYIAQNLCADDTDRLEIVRRLSIIFSSVSAPGSVDYIVDAGGITALEGTEDAPTGKSAPVAQPTVDQLGPPSTQLAPMDVGFVESETASNGLPSEPLMAPDDEDEWNAFWENDKITEEMYLQIPLS